MRKKLAMMLCLCMAFTLLPVVAVADDTVVEVSDFAGLQNAVTNTTADTTIKLADGYTGAVGMLTVTGSHQITIDLNGKTLDGGQNAALSVNDSGTLTLQNGFITASKSDPRTAPISAILVNDTANFFLQGCTVSAGLDANAIRKNSTGNLVIDSSAVEASQGAAISCASTGNVSLLGNCEISTNANYKSAIHCMQNMLTIKGDVSIKAPYEGAINSAISEPCSIEGGTVVIQGNPALSSRPKTSDYQNLKITASMDFDGSNPESYDESKINQYPYLKFEPDVVAQVGSTSFVTVQAALDAAADGDTVQLLQDRSEAVTLARGNHKNLTLDLGGHKLDGGNDAAISHQGSGKLTITGAGVITANGTSNQLVDAQTMGTIVLSSGSLEVDSGEIIVTGKNKSVIINQGAGDVIITGDAKLKNNCAANNYTIYNGTTGTVTLSGNASIVSKAGTACEIFNGSTGAVNITGNAQISTQQDTSRAIRNESTGKISISGNAVVVAKGNALCATIELISGTESDVVLEMSGGTVQSEGWGGKGVRNDGNGVIRLSGGTIKTTDVNGTSIVSNGRVVIPGGTVLLQGGSNVSYGAPDTANYYPRAIITASRNYDGSAPESYDYRNVPSYKYLKFEPDMASMPAVTVGNVMVAGKPGTPIAPGKATLTLTNTEFKALAEGTDVSDWFTNLPAGLAAKIEAVVAEHDTVATIALSGTPAATSTAAMTVTIPAEHLQSGVALVAAENAQAKWDIVVPAAQPHYAVTKGQNGQWSKEARDGLSITVNADYSKFTAGGSVMVDGVQLTRDQYTSQSGSTIITLPAAYLESLPVGTHTLRVNLVDGYAETSFTILSQSTEAGAKAGTGISAKTGDSNQMWLWCLLMVLSVGGAVAIGIAQKKRRNQ